MNYQKVYNAIVEKRKMNVPEGYKECHHIIPKSMGGSDDASNLVYLTVREHYIAHQLLWKIHRTSKMAHAWFMMLRCDPNQQRFFTSRQHEKATIAHVEVLRETMKGEGNHFFGKTHSLEARERISRNNKEHLAKHGKTQEVIDNWIEKVAKRPKSAEHRKKIGRSGFKMLKNIHTGESIRVSVGDVYDDIVWKNPAHDQKRSSCVHCGKESTVGNINRWHNTNCKNKA